MRILVALLLILIVALVTAQSDTAAAKKQFTQIRVMKRRAYHSILKFLAYLKNKYAGMPIDTAYCLNGIMRLTKGKFPKLFAEAESIRNKDAIVQQTKFPDQYKMFATLMMQERYVKPWIVGGKLPPALRFNAKVPQFEFNEKMSDQCITGALSCNVKFEDEKNSCFYKYLNTNTKGYVTTHQVCSCDR